MRSIILTAGIVLAATAISVASGPAKPVSSSQAVNRKQATKLTRVVVETGKTKRVQYVLVPLTEPGELAPKLRKSQTSVNQTPKIRKSDDVVFELKQLPESRGTASVVRQPFAPAVTPVTTRRTGSAGSNPPIRSLRSSAVTQSSPVGRSKAARVSNDVMFDLTPLNEAPMGVAVSGPGDGRALKNSRTEQLPPAIAKVASGTVDPNPFSAPAPKRAPRSNVPVQSLRLHRAAVVQSEPAVRSFVTSDSDNDVMFDLAPLPDEPVGFATLGPVSPTTAAVKTDVAVESPAGAVAAIPEARRSRLPMTEAQASVDNTEKFSRPEFLSDLEQLSRRAVLNDHFRPERRRFSLASQSRVINESVPQSVDELFAPIANVSVRNTNPNGPTDSASAILVAEVPPSYYGTVDYTQPERSRGCHAFAHRPLYFEEKNLERCGINCGPATTAVSFARFLGTTVVLPYHLTVRCPTQLVASGYDCSTGRKFPNSVTMSPWDL